MNPLSEYPEIRKYLYTLYWVVGIVLGSLSAAYSLGDTIPHWLKVFAVVYGYVAIPLGFTAAQNVTRKKGEREAA